MITANMQFLLPLSAVLLRTSSHCATGYYLCAAAIAVRTIAPYLKSKVTDPAVLVADESGKFLISLLSGHIGGANEWCEELAGSIGAIPVITTATDTRGMFAVDLFATSHNMRIVNPVMIQDISGRILNGEPVGITGDETFSELLKETEKQRNGQITFTDNADGKYESGVQIITHTDENTVFKRTLQLVPKNLAVGIGCKRGKSAEEIEQAVKKFLLQIILCRRELLLLLRLTEKQMNRELLNLQKNAGCLIRHLHRNI